MSTFSSNAQSAFSILAKPTGAACNLACDYCFYLSKDLLYPGSQFQMSNEVLETYIRQLLSSQPTPEVSVNWQGGEPTLMGLDFFRRSVELVNRHKKPDQRVSYTLQTNGTLLDEEWCVFFKKSNFLIGLSLDGPAEMHNAYRCDKGGQGSYDKVRNGWNLLQKHNVDANILCAVNAANACRPLEVYRFFRDELQAQFIQFIPVVERMNPEIAGETLPDHQAPLAKASINYQRTGDRVSQRSVQPGQFGSFLIAIFEEWVHHDVGKVFVQSFDAALASWSGLPASVCVFQEVCGSSLVLEQNGDVYSCDHFVGPAYRLGNILEKPLKKIAASQQQQRFGLNKRDRLPAFCRECDVLFACHGECPRNRFERISNRGAAQGEDGLNYLCAGYKLFFRHIDRSMRIMVDLLQRGRAPADIMKV